jgi:hypothetical protein
LVVFLLALTIINNSMRGHSWQAVYRIPDAPLEVSPASGRKMAIGGGTEQLLGLQQGPPGSQGAECCRHHEWGSFMPALPFYLVADFID